MLQTKNVLCAFVVMGTLNAQNNLEIDGREIEINNSIDQDLNTVGSFSATHDIYLNTVNFEFQDVFYSPRGLPFSQKTYLLNGISQNRLFDYRPAWSNWGGVGIIYKGQEIEGATEIPSTTMGHGLATYSLNTRASIYKKGTRLSYAVSNRSYEHKIAVDHKGIFLRKWHYVLSASKRFGAQGYREGTFFDSNSLMFGVEKSLGNKHSLSATYIRAPVQRGLAGFYTDEVLSLKGYAYNANWGFQNHKKRNARVRSIDEPLFLLTHVLESESKLKWRNSILLQKGSISNSRLDYNGIVNPDPTYYQKLPSYELSRNHVDFEDVYRKDQLFRNNGQLDWNALYQTNLELKQVGKNAAVVLYNNRRDEQRLQIHTDIFSKLKSNLAVYGALDYRNVGFENYAEIADLLGGQGYLDVASFTNAQSNLQTLNRVVKNGNRFKYNYKIHSNELNFFSKVSWKSRRVELQGATSLNYVEHQRLGNYLYENTKDAFGKSKKLDVFSKSIRVHALYKISNRHLLSAALGLQERPKALNVLFPNARYSNRILEDLRPERLQSNAITYIYRGTRLQTKFTSFFTTQQNVAQTDFYFAEGFGSKASYVREINDLQTENSLFVNQVLQNIAHQYYGFELGSSFDISESLSIKGVAGVGNYRYANNPNLVLFTEDGVGAQNLGFIEGRKDLGNSEIKGFKLSNGPQQALSFQISYTDPNYWRFNVSVNHFRNNYVNIAPIKYTSNFTNELNTTPIQNIDKNLLDVFRGQERLSDFTLVHLSGGKSWKIKKSYLRVFWMLRNVLGVRYRTGGFTSSRLANYTEQLEEYTREKPLFGNRYFTGNERTFFGGIYYAF